MCSVLHRNDLFNDTRLIIDSISSALLSETYKIRENQKERKPISMVFTILNL